MLLIKQYETATYKGTIFIIFHEIKTHLPFVKIGPIFYIHVTLGQQELTITQIQKMSKALKHVT